MFESRLQAAQVLLFGAGISLGVAVLTFGFGPAVVGVFFLVVEHALATGGCAIYAAAKGYPPQVGIPLGIGLGTMGAAAIAILPDQSPDDSLERSIRLGRAGEENARRRDPGYEVLDDEDE